MDLALVPFLALACCPPQGDDSEPVTAEAVPAEEVGEHSVARELEWRFAVSTFAGAAARADFDGAAGSLGAHRFGFGVSASRPLDELYTAGVGVRWARSAYDFGAGSFGLPGGDPFDSLSSYGVWTSLAKWDEADDLNWTGFVFANAGLESGASASDGTTFGGGGTVHYRHSESFAMSLGLYGTTLLEDDFLVYPVSAIDWQVSEDLHIGDEGDGVGVGLRFNDELKSYFNIAFGVNQFRLDDQGVVPRGVFRDEDFAANLGLVWTPTERLTAELALGVAWREVTFLFDGGGGVSQDLDPAPFAAMRLSYGL